MCAFLTCWADAWESVKGCDAEGSEPCRDSTRTRQETTTGQKATEMLTCRTLMNWANPGCYGDLKSYNRDLVKPMRLARSKDASPEELAAVMFRCF